MQSIDAARRTIQSHWWYLSFIILIGCSVALCTYIQSIPTFPDPDSFYHIGMSRLIPEQGVISTFPWLQFSVLKDSYTNQHFLYHLFLTPFTHWMNPIQGAKLAQVILNTGFIVLFYWLLRRMRVPGAFWFALLLMVTAPFMFRLNLVKAPVVSLLFLFFGLYCLFRYKYLALFFTAFGYVWAYGGFLLLPVFSAVYALISVLTDWFRRGNIQPFSVVARNSKEIRMFFVATAGMLAGVLINPQFPQNIIFYWRQLVAIGIVNYQDIISVGGEWYPYNPVQLGADALLVTMLIVIALAVLITNWRRPSRQQLLVTAIFIFFLAFTLKSRRYVEYYIPAAVLWIALTIRHYAGEMTPARIWRLFHAAARQYKVVVVVMAAYILIMVPMIVIKDMRKLHQDYQAGISINRFAGAGAWLARNALPGETVFHSSWDEFPILFYRSPQAYYISGLDPTFSYEYDRELWNTIVDITTGKQRTGVYEAIRDTFQARYVFVEGNHTAMDRVIEQTDGFYRVYQDDEAAIYGVKTSL